MAGDLGAARPGAASPGRAGLAPASAVVHLGRPAREAGAALNPAVVLSATFVQDGSPSPATGQLYQRVDYTPPAGYTSAAS